MGDDNGIDDLRGVSLCIDERYNIKMHLKEIVCDGINWIHLVQVRV
jgi:hypothetical protein